MTHQNRSQHVSLGCGTLILIAVIVAIFSTPEIDELKSDVNNLQRSVDHLQQTLNSQNESIREIRKMLKEMRSAEQPAEGDADPSDQ